MQIKQSSRRREEEMKGCEKKTFCFLLLSTSFLRNEFNENPLRGIFAEMTVCIYQFFMTLSTSFLRESWMNFEGVSVFSHPGVAAKEALLGFNVETYAIN